MPDIVHAGGLIDAKMSNEFLETFFLPNVQMQKEEVARIAPAVL